MRATTPERVRSHEGKGEIVAGRRRCWQRRQDCSRPTLPVIRASRAGAQRVRQDADPRQRDRLGHVLRTKANDVPGAGVAHQHRAVLDAVAVLADGLARIDAVDVVRALADRVSLDQADAHLRRRERGDFRSPGEDGAPERTVAVAVAASGLELALSGRRALCAGRRSRPDARRRGAMVVFCPVEVLAGGDWLRMSVGEDGGDTAVLGGRSERS